MTRDEQIAEALRVIRPVDRDRCRADIEQIIEIIDNETVADTQRAALASKQTRDTVQVLRAALCRVRDLRAKLAEPIREGEFKDLDVSRHIDICDAIVDQAPPRATHPADKQRMAAAGAQELLMAHDGKLSATRGGQWDRLSAILFGDPGANMFQYIRELI